MELDGRQRSTIVIKLRPTFIKTVQNMFSGMMEDDCEINPVVKVDDGFGTDTFQFPHSNNIVKGSLQDVLRIPGTPETGDTTVIVGNYIIKLPWDVKIEVEPDVPTKQCQIVVNGGAKYQVMNVYTDKSDRLTVCCYCFEVH